MGINGGRGINSGLVLGGSGINIAGGGGFVGLLDTYGGAAAAYSVRRLSSTYTGALIEVRRSSDNTTQDISYDTNGDLDTAALLAFVGAGDGFVRTWHDQSGNGNNYQQTTTTKQPQIVSSGSLLTDNTKPLIANVDGSTEMTASFSGNANRWIFGTVRVVNAALSCFYFEAPNDYVAIAQNGSTATFVNGATLNALYNNGAAITASRDSMYDNFLTSSVLTIDINDSGFSSNTLGYGAAGSLGMYNMQEVVFYNSNQTANKSGIESNIADYYGIILP